MSVSHPLAADDSHANAEPDLQSTGRSDPAAAQDVGPEVAVSRGASRSMLPEQVLVAPECLGLESRKEFRKLASDLIDRTTTGSGHLVIDCGRLQSIDSAGLNALILVQRKATNRRVHVILRDLDEGLQALLVLTKLDDLFTISASH